MKYQRWITRDGQHVVVNELCRCGHRRSSHLGTGPLSGHGACTNRNCSCGKYTWRKCLTKPVSQVPEAATRYPKAA